jgi:hypothetical protein
MNTEKISKVFLLLIFVGLIYLFYYRYKYKDEIENHLGITICKFTFCKSGRKTQTAYIKYFLNDTLYRRSEGSCPENYEKKLNKYFLLKYSTKDNDKIEVDFSKEVSDVEKIDYLESKLKNWFDLPYVSE